MPDEDRSDITELLKAWSSGDEAALSDLMPKVYPELRRVARKHLASGLPGHTLESAALVNEAYLKLIRGHGIRCENRLQFLSVEETADVLRVSPETAKRDWKMAKAWLLRQPSGDRSVN